jgi:hypothetical protein
VNPIITQDDLDGGEEMPFMELELSHKLSVNFSQYTTEVIDFTIVSKEVEITNLGLYF